jgi:hypothetical protein
MRLRAGGLVVVWVAGLALVGCGGEVRSATVATGSDAADAADGDVATLFFAPDGALVLTVCPMPSSIDPQIDHFAIPGGKCVDWPPPPECPTCAQAKACVFSVRFGCPNGQRSPPADWTCDCPAGDWHCIRTDQFGGRCPDDGGNF